MEEGDPTWEEEVKALFLPSATGLNKGLMDIDSSLGAPKGYTLLQHVVVADCAAAVVAHLSRLNCAPIVAGLEASTRPHDVYAHGRVRVDASTMANLELVLGAESTPEGSLLRRISFGCVTDAGRRTLRRWIAAPLLDVGTIRERQDAVWATVDRGGVAAEAVETAPRRIQCRRRRRCTASLT